MDYIDEIIKALMCFKEIVKIQEYRITVLEEKAGFDKSEKGDK